jgi:hypothetical protein
MQFSLRKLMATVSGIAIVLAVVMMLTITWRRQLTIQHGLKTNGASWVGFPSADARLLPSVLYERPIAENFQHQERMGTVELKCYDVTPQCLNRLGTLEHIENLYFINCDLCDDDLVALPAIHLDTVLFWNANITDASIDTIAKAHDLKKVTFKTTNVSPQGIQRLQTALPGVEIVFAP